MPGLARSVSDSITCTVLNMGLVWYSILAWYSIMALTGPHLQGPRLACVWHVARTALARLWQRLGPISVQARYEHLRPVLTYEGRFSGRSDCWTRLPSSV